MATAKVPPPSAAGQLAGLIDSPEIAAFVSELDATRWTGRPGYPVRTMVGMTLAKALYALPTWTRTVALVREHDTRAPRSGASAKPTCPASTRATASRASCGPSRRC